VAMRRVGEENVAGATARAAEPAVGA
jgi:hypothetical protein